MMAFVWGADWFLLTPQLRLGPPSVKGLGDMPELLAAMPSSVDLSETFLADILGR